MHQIKNTPNKETTDLSDVSLSSIQPSSHHSTINVDKQEVERAHDYLICKGQSDRYPSYMPKFYHWDNQNTEASIKEKEFIVKQLALNNSTARKDCEYYDQARSSLLTITKKITLCPHGRAKYAYTSQDTIDQARDIITRTDKILRCLDRLSVFTNCYEDCYGEMRFLKCECEYMSYSRASLYVIADYFHRYS